MDRINGANTVDIGSGRRGWRMRNLLAGIAGTEFTAGYQNASQEELIGLIEAAGLTPDENDWGQVLQAIMLLTAPRMQVFLASGSFTVPAHVTRLKVRAWGAGGSGGGSSDLGWPGGGGGAGGYGEVVLGVTPGQVIPVVVGHGTAGANGGATTFGTLVCNGGGKGGEGSAGLVGAGGAGGSVAGADLAITGSYASSGIVYGATGVVEGGSGASGFGTSITRAVGSNSVGFNGNAGQFPGGGASGCTNSTAPGGNGLAVVEW
ncbi:hypothetical protein GXW74_15505 [Roseomonas eburnea]|uniref:Glycine-rich domain-containing protein n=1 Tax=Neoroseomonas eburnea TaxID=1346889 RepID=A0A9X9XDW4_9PROT|nr:hypothetical protein [Neoroseomonas eburnea]MBR0681900.1 hypothetical protein [Neoroseomonas eburnea]